MKLSSRGKTALLVVATATVVVVGVAHWRSAHDETTAVPSSRPTTGDGDVAAKPGDSDRTPTTPEHPQGATSGDEDPVQLRPLPASSASLRHEWTQGDGRDVQVIQRIAHNPEEVIKMVEENDRIHGRQLVYRKETFDGLVLSARAKGEAVRRFILPGMDGQEIEVEVDRADLSPSGQSGSVTGHLTGRPDSMVTLAYQFGREAFTVLSREDGIYLQADPREPGELIVKSIDPETYAPGRCGTDEHIAGE